MLLRGPRWGLPPQPGALGWGLTMPSSTQKPSCSRAWGRRMMAVVTGGQWTMLRVTNVCDFTSCAGWGTLAQLGRWGLMDLLASCSPLWASVYPPVKWRSGVKALGDLLDSRRALGKQLRTEMGAGWCQHWSCVASHLPESPDLSFCIVKSKCLAVSATQGDKRRVTCYVNHVRHALRT